MSSLPILNRCIFCLLGVMSLGVFSAQVSAAEDVISDDGREVRLNDDGTWSFLSRDRYASTIDGRRIRLIPDGRWEIMTDDVTGVEERSQATNSSVNGAAATTQVTRKIVRQPSNTGGNPSILLTRVDILKKKTKTHKAIKVDTRTAFYLQVANHSKHPIALSQALKNSVKASDSKGRQYDTLLLRYKGDQIASGASKQIIVLIDGAPRWYGVKNMNLKIDANTFGDNSSILLSKNMNDIDNKIVEGF